MEHADRGAAPAGVGARGDDHDVVAGRDHVAGQHVQTLGLDAVVVGHQDPHAANVPEGELPPGVEQATPP